MSDNDSVLRTSQTLLERVRNPNDEEAWKDFIAYYEQYIYIILRSIKISEPDAKALCQDIIVKLWKKMPEFTYNKDRGKFRNWLAIVIRNEANRYFTANSRTLKVMEGVDSEELEGHEDTENINVEKVIEDEWNRYISNLAWESIKGRFKETMQKVFLLYVEGKSNKEIAEICGINESSVRNCNMRIREHLKSEIDKFNSELL